MIIFLLIVAAMGFLFRRMPTAYLQDEDQGFVIVQVLLPANSTLEQTEKVMKDVRDYFLEREKDAVESCMTASVTSFSSRGQNTGMSFVKLKDWKLRDRADLRVKAVDGRAMKAFARMRKAMVFAFPPPPVVELGTARGVDFQLVDRGGLGHDALMGARNQFLGAPLFSFCLQSL